MKLIAGALPVWAARFFAGLFLVLMVGSAGPAVAQDAALNGGYTLGAGDKVRVIVFGEDDLGGQFEVDSNGYLRMPLIGQVKAAGLSVHDFENQVKLKLDDGYLKDAKVNVEVLSYRPFSIIGEVNKPGEYPYSSDMTVLNAVAKAGGYTYRADQSSAYIRRAGTNREISVSADQAVKIYPGDVVRIAERFF